MKRIKKLWKTSVSAVNGWMDDQAMSLAAALSYYALFSIAPLLLISLAVAGTLFGEEASRNQIFQTFDSLIGPEGARGIQSMVESAALHEGASILATITGVVMLLVGATTVFGQLQDSLNRIWKVEPRPGSGFKHLIRQRVLSFSIVLVIAFLLLVSLILSAVISGMGKYFSENLPGGEALWKLAETGFSFGVTVLLFGALYKILPDVKLRWRDVGSGALITAIFFTVGKLLIGLYLGKSSVTSAYGVGGSLVVFLIWAYYSSAIVLYGAEFTAARQRAHGTKLVAKPGARLFASANASPAAREPRPAASHSGAATTPSGAARKPRKRPPPAPQVH